MEAVAGQRGVVSLDVDFHFAFQTKLPQEAMHGGNVAVVLVLGWLVRLGFDQQLALEADAVLVLDHHLHEAPELLAFAREVGVEEGVVAFTAAPQHIVCATELLRRVHRAEYLGCCTREHLGVWVGGPARGVTRMAKEVGRAPQQLYAGALLVRAHHVDHRVEIAAVFAQRGTVGRSVGIVEGVVGYAELLEELERGLRLALGLHQRLGPVKPRTLEHTGAKHVGTRRAERVPIAHCQTQVLAHALAEQFAIGVVVAEGEGRLTLGTFVADAVDKIEDAHS